MPRPALKIDLSKKDRVKLKRLLDGGIQQVRVVLRALALLQLGDGGSAPQIAKSLHFSAQAVRNIANPTFAANGYFRGKPVGTSS